jgi:hypothetical protein
MIKMKIRDLKIVDLTLWQNILLVLKLPRSQRQVYSMQLGQIQMLRAIGYAAMDELSNIQTYNAQKIHATLAVTNPIWEEIVKGNNSPDHEATFQQDIEAFVNRMLEVKRVTASRIAQELQRTLETESYGDLDQA